MKWKTASSQLAQNERAKNRASDPYSGSQEILGNLSPNALAPVQFQNSNQIQNTSSAHILAPDSAPLRIIETEEELEVKRVSLFVEILSFEFAKHRGYKAENWQSLYDYYWKFLANGKMWSSRNEKKIISLKSFLYQGMLTQETQARLYGNEPWYPNYAENERESTIKWIKTLDSGDVEYTLHSWFEGDLYSKREQIEKNAKDEKMRLRQSQVRQRKADPQIIEFSIIEELLKRFKKQWGYPTKDVTVIVLYFRKVRGAVELLSNMDEDDVEFTLGKYFEAIAHQETTNKVADIEAVFTQVQKPPKKKRKLPSRVFKQLLDPDASKNASGNLSSSPSMSKIGNSSAINANLAASQSLNVINSDIMYKKYNELSSIMKLLERYKHEQLRYTNDPQALVTYYKELPLSESQVYKLPSDPKELEIILNRFFSRNILITRMYALYRFIYGFYSNNTRTIFDFWNSIEIEDKYRAGIYCKNSEEMLSYITSFFENQEKMKKEEEVAKVLRHEEESKRYKGKYANIKRPSLYQKNEKRLALGKNLMELSKKFPLDPVLKKMLKVEMQFNIHLKFDLEFDTANEQEENARKSRLRNLSSIKKRDLRSQDEIMRQTWEKSKFMDQQENQNKAAELRLLKAQEQEMQKVIQELVKQYLNKRQIQQIPISKQLGISYASLKTQFPLAIKKHFPYYNYGRAKKENGEFTFNKSYPLVWKHHFFSLVKSYLRTSEGLILLKSLPCNFWTPPSSSKCTVHANMDCPPNCGYVTLNKKALKQTFIEEKYVMNWHEKLRPWARPDVAEQKEKIFMSYADARECTFEPKTGSKVPKKHLDLAMQTFSELRNTIMPGEAPNFAMWVNRMGQNFRSRDPLIYKAGVFKQAKAIFLQGAPEQAKKKLIENFNIPCILDHFEPGKPRPTINEKPLEIFNNPQNLELMTNVYQLYSSIREIKIDLRRQIEKLKIEDQRETKIYMCPCKDDNCPGDVKPRLNNSDVATNIQLGKNCSLAHHTFELRFKQEEIARKKARQRAIENLSKLIQEYKPKPAWKPDGKLNDCLRCQQTFLYKPTDESKGPTKVDDYARSLGCFCNKCALEQRLKMKHASFIEKAKEKNKQFKKDPEQLAKELANCKKLGIYRKALTLFKNRRTVAAFTSISEAIKILREEREVERKVIEISKSRIIEKIGIDPSLSLTQTQELNRTVESSPNADGTSVQKIALFKAQTEKLYVGTANHFMNHQIELLYLQIEEKLMKDHQHIESLREKAEILEDLEQEGDKNEKPVGFLFKKNKVKMCVFVKEKKKCPNGKDCQDAHSAIELDLVPKQKVAENLYQTSEALENRLKNDILAEDWKPWNEHYISRSEPFSKAEKDLTGEKTLGRLPFERNY